MIKIKSVISLTFALMTIPAARTSVVNQTSRDSSHHIESRDFQPHREPCCLPYRFQAVITSLPSFSAEAKMVSRVYRDWERKLQIQESTTFNSHGIENTLSTIFMDYKNMVEYMYTPGRPCRQVGLDHGMLEPCMPENATYLGKSYIGAYSDKTNFDAWNFRRTNLNRDIEMTIIVTSDKCVPVSEHITGRLGGNQMDDLVLFTNLTEQVDDSVFNLPVECLGVLPM